MSKMRETRMKMGLSLPDVAERLGITPASVYYYESGKRNIPTDIAERYAKMVGKKVDDIFLPEKFTNR